MNSIIGKEFNNLTVLKKCLHRDKYNRKFYNCLCKCGNYKIIRYDSIIYEYTKSCGCLNKESGRKLLTKHNMCKTQIYRCWQNIKDRCNNINNKRYKDYGGRGIIYDPNWNKFENFLKDMYFKWVYAKKKYQSAVLSIERENVNGNYTFENCIFIPINFQARNRRNSL